MRPIAKLICDERAATAVEYGLILSLIVIAIVAGVTQLGSKTSNNWNNVANEVSKG
jgi:pilus assembly protein Flp/PilA